MKTQTAFQPHPDLSKPAKRLRCCCCGGEAYGRQFHNQDLGYGLGACCVSFVTPRIEDMARTYGIEGIHFKLDTPAQVRVPGSAQEWDTWHITQNLSDRFGELNYHDAENKPLGVLEADAELLERLRSQLTDELTFIVRKDGQFGLLIEVEYCSRESEVRNADHTDAWYLALKPHAELVVNLLNGLSALAPLYPGVAFAVPEEKWIVHDRAAAWAFIPDGHLTQEQRTALARAMSDL